MINLTGTLPDGHTPDLTITLVLRSLIKNTIKTLVFSVYSFCVDVYHFRICDGVGIKINLYALGNIMLMPGRSVSSNL